MRPPPEFSFQAETGESLLITVPRPRHGPRRNPPASCAGPLLFVHNPIFDFTGLPSRRVRGSPFTTQMEAPGFG